LEPMQERPESEGAGFVHVRVLVVIPWPQVTEHWSQDCHVVQLPST